MYMLKITLDRENPEEKVKTNEIFNEKDPHETPEAPADVCTYNPHKLYNNFSQNIKGVIKCQ